MLVVGPRKFFEDVYINYIDSKGDSSHSMYVTTPHGRDRGLAYARNGRVAIVHGHCGIFAPVYIFTAFRLGVMPFFYFQPLALNMHRINGEFSLGVMRGFTQRRPTPDSPVLAALDLTQKVKCVVGETTSCRKTGERDHVAPKSQCSGGTEWVKVAGEEGTGLWLCQKYTNVSCR